MLVTSMDWASSLKVHNLEHSMSHRGSCYNNAVAESFFNLLKRERTRCRTYITVPRHGKMGSTSLRCSAIRTVSIGETGCCRPLSSNGIKNPQGEPKPN